jgi:hypothetical protein
MAKQREFERLRSARRELRCITCKRERAGMLARRESGRSLAQQSFGLSSEGRTNPRRRQLAAQIREFCGLAALAPGDAFNLGRVVCRRPLRCVRGSRL